MGEGGPSTQGNRGGKQLLVGRGGGLTAGLQIDELRLSHQALIQGKGAATDHGSGGNSS